MTPNDLNVLVSLADCPNDFRPIQWASKQNYIDRRTIYRTIDRIESMSKKSIYDGRGELTDFGVEMAEAWQKFTCNYFNM